MIKFIPFLVNNWLLQLIVPSMANLISWIFRVCVGRTNIQHTKISYCSSKTLMCLRKYVSLTLVYFLQKQCQTFKLQIQDQLISSHNNGYHFCWHEAFKFYCFCYLFSNLIWYMPFSIFFFFFAKSLYQRCVTWS